MFCTMCSVADLIWLIIEAWLIDKNEDAPDEKRVVKGTIWCYLDQER